MNSPSAESSVPAAAAPVLNRRSMGAAILTDLHFWVPVVVLALGLGLLVYIS